MYSKQTKVINVTGLHARPASDFVMAAKKFESAITVKNVDAGTPETNAKSIVRLLAEGIGQGTTIEISANGPDEQLAVDALVELVDSGFGE